MPRCVGVWRTKAARMNATRAVCVRTYVPANSRTSHSLHGRPNEVYCPAIRHQRPERRHSQQHPLDGPLVLLVLLVLPLLLCRRRRFFGCATTAINDTAVNDPCITDKDNLWVLFIGDRLVLHAQCVRQDVHGSARFRFEAVQNQRGRAGHCANLARRPQRPNTNARALTNATMCRWSRRWRTRGGGRAVAAFNCAVASSPTLSTRSSNGDLVTRWRPGRRRRGWFVEEVTAVTNKLALVFPKDVSLPLAVARQQRRRVGVLILLALAKHLLAG